MGPDRGEDGICVHVLIRSGRVEVKDGDMVPDRGGVEFGCGTNTGSLGLQVDGGLWGVFCHCRDVTRGL